MADERKIAGRIERLQLWLDPPIVVFNVTLETEYGIWRHTAGSLPDLQIFLEGVRAGAAMAGGYFSPPPVAESPFRQISLANESNPDDEE